MILEAGLVGSRFVHFTCAILLFGGSLFELYAAPWHDKSVRSSRMLPAILLASALGAIVSGLTWFLFATANMTGTLAGVIDRDALLTVLQDTAFGTVWASRLALLALPLAVIVGLRKVGRPDRRLIVITTCLSAVLLATLAGVGHAQVEDGVASVVHVTADAAHLLAAGAWLGGLLPLGLMLASRQDGQSSTDDAVAVLSRFSGMGYLAVAVLVLTGAINSWYLIGSVTALQDTTYGRLLLLKLLLFGLMLLLAVANRFWLVPALVASQSQSVPDPYMRLRGHILGEQFLGLLVVGTVSLLGTLAPAAQ